MDKNNIILGCGHTGTTLISGILHLNGYKTDCVDNLYENPELVRINKEILQNNINKDRIKNFFKEINKKNKYWTLKDPRLSDTIDILYNYIDVPVRYIYNFREPGSTVNHLIKEYKNAEMSYKDKLKASENEWYSKNIKILNFLSKLEKNDYIIINYDDLIELKLNSIINRFIGKKLNYGFIKPKKRKSKSIKVNKKLIDLYTEINKKYEENLIFIIKNYTEITPINLIDKFYTNINDFTFKMKRRIKNCYFINE